MKRQVFFYGTRAANLGILSLLAAMLLWYKFCCCNNEFRDKPGFAPGA
jgi:hypothetical protein